MRISNRSQIDSFLVMDIMEAARAAEAAGQSVIHMEIGQPLSGAPLSARQSLGAQVSAYPLGYTVALGLPALRGRIAQHYLDHYGVEVSPDRIVVTSGASGAFLLAFTALFEAGDRVGLALPCYPSYRQILRALDVTPVGFRTSIDSGFQPVSHGLPDDLSGLIVTSPGNPTGSILAKEAMGDLAQTCKDRDIALISDEIYHGLEYGARATSALELTDDVYVINSFSKYFTMTGWRLGWMVVPPDHVRTIERLAQNMFICAPHVSQKLALDVMDDQRPLDQLREGYGEARQMILDRLPSMGLGRISPPDGAFYIWVDVSDYTDDSLALCYDILSKTGVAVAPGVDFDPEQGHNWIRLSYAQGPGPVTEGLDRLAAYFANLT